MSSYRGDALQKSVPPERPKRAPSEMKPSEEYASKTSIDTPYTYEYANVKSIQVQSYYDSQKVSNATLQTPLGTLTHNLINPSHDAVITFDYTHPKTHQPTTPTTRKNGTHSLMRQPLMRNNDLRMSPQPTLNPPRLPIPENNIPIGVPARDPLPVR